MWTIKTSIQCDVYKCKNFDYTYDIIASSSNSAIVTCYDYIGCCTALLKATTLFYIDTESGKITRSEGVINDAELDSLMKCVEPPPASEL